MKRAIKFRGKRPDGSWNYGRSIIFKRSGAVLIQGAKVYPDTVGQFTGLHDAQGKEIYEGDILRMSCRKDDLGIVKLENEAAAFTIREKGKLRWWYLINRHYELVGNIHDNPELLKGGSNGSH